MNIFILDNNPATAAQYLCDRHIPKMLLESAQLICTALVLTQKVLSKPTSDITWDFGTVGYGNTHTNHPCSKWARADLANLSWLWAHFDEQCAEYTRRYGKTHLTEIKMRNVDCFRPNVLTTNCTPFAQAMPDQYKDVDAVKAYRSYYYGEKRRFAKWQKLNNTPQWWSDFLTQQA
jgi:hypothetical protein